MGNVIPYCIPSFLCSFSFHSPWRRGPRGQKGATATSVPLFFVLLGRAGGLSCTAGRVGCHACRGEGGGWNSAPRHRAGGRSEPQSQFQESRRGAPPRGVLAVVFEPAALKTVGNWPWPQTQNLDVGFSKVKICENRPFVQNFPLFAPV